MYEIATILDIISSFSSTLALNEILARVTEKTAQIIGTDSCAISLWNQTNNTVVVLADYIAPDVVIPEGDVEDLGMSYPLDKYPATARVLQEQTPLIIDIDHPTADEAEQNLLKLFQWAGLLMLPLVYKGQSIGVMELYVDQDRSFRFTPDKIELCQALANQAVIAIENARLFAESEAQRESLIQISTRLVNSQEEERRRLARELHDDLGQLLTAMKINLDIARRALPPDSAPKLRRSLDEAGRLATQTQERARRLSLALHPSILDDLGLISALRWQLDAHEQRTNQIISFETDLDELELSSELKLAIYRIISEALTNIARHAQASHVHISLQSQQRHIIVGIEDDGVGFDAAAWLNSPLERRSLGLISMRERAQLLGGQFIVTSQGKQGTKVLAQFPLPPPIGLASKMKVN